MSESPKENISIQLRIKKIEQVRTDITLPTTPIDPLSLNHTVKMTNLLDTGQ
jgi:hypothetical protein